MNELPEKVLAYAAEGGGVEFYRVRADEDSDWMYIATSPSIALDDNDEDHFRESEKGPSASLTGIMDEVGLAKYIDTFFCEFIHEDVLEEVDRYVINAFNPERARQREEEKERLLQHLRRKRESA